MDSSSKKKCTNARCFAHDGERCALGWMKVEQCPSWPALDCAHRWDVNDDNGPEDFWICKACRTNGGALYGSDGFLQPPIVDGVRSWDGVPGVARLQAAAYRVARERFQVCELYPSDVAQTEPTDDEQPCATWVTTEWTCLRVDRDAWAKVLFAGEAAYAWRVLRGGSTRNVLKEGSAADAFEAMCAAVKFMDTLPEVTP